MFTLLPHCNVNQSIKFTSAYVTPSWRLLEKSWLLPRSRKLPHTAIMLKTNVFWAVESVKISVGGTILTRKLLSLMLLRTKFWSVGYLTWLWLSLNLKISVCQYVGWCKWNHVISHNLNSFTYMYFRYNRRIWSVYSPLMTRTAPPLIKSLS